MNTSVGYHQAPRPARVPLDEVLVRLYPEGFIDESFEADGINVGPGGLSMRASMLPEVGSTLRCQLESPGSEVPIEMIGQVVWAHDSGPQLGEFGIRFTRLSDGDQNRIEALIQRWGRTTATAPTVRLQLDGVESPIVAEFQSETDQTLRVEQTLPFLAIGSGVENEATGRRGHLETVELMFDEEVPKLVLSIGYQTDASVEAAGDDPELGRDTMPDAIERPSRPNQRTSAPRLHDTPTIVRYDAQEELSFDPSTADRVRDYARAASDQVSSSVGNMKNAITQGVIPSVTRATRRSATVASRFVEALRERLEDKPRRKQVPRSEAARAHLKNSKRSGRRYVLIALVITLVALSGWGIYLWAASPAPALDAPVEVADVGESPTGASPDAAAPVPVEPEAEPEGSAQAALVPDQGAPLPPERVQGLVFGADDVPGGEAYVLRMSNPVTEMDGLVEDDGFSVMIPGSLSLSRAGPIATAHPDVEHAAIHNRGDFSELTLRFVAGRHPAYRVQARGPAIEITIAR
ncbi:MAG: PilZ domain-containing protein [Myxococcota bacterium]